MEKRADEAFDETLLSILRSPGESSRALVIKLALGLCRKLDLRGARGDISLIARKVGISKNFSTRILGAYLDGSEDTLMSRKRRKTAFAGSEWEKRFHDFVFLPEYARPVPGLKII